MKLSEYNLRLYGLLRRCLRGNFVSPAAHQPDGRMRAGMLASMRTLEVGRRCGCGDAFCYTFWTLAPPADPMSLFMVRFLVSGVLHVTCDAAGTIHKIEWLCSDDDVRPTRVWCRDAGGGWTPREPADAESSPR